MDLLYASVLLCIAYLAYQALYPMLAEKTGLDTDRVKVKTQYPSLYACIDRLPDEEKIYKELCYKYARRFVDAYERSYDPAVPKEALLRDMSHARKKVEGYMYEIIFRIPNDIHLEARLRASTELVCMFMDAYVKDTKSRARRNV